MTLTANEIGGAEPPAWFADAVAQQTVERVVEVDGARVVYRCWNPSDEAKPGLLLVHGFRAHSRWWDFIAPSLTPWYRVYALDFTGMGDSDHREQYSLEQHSRELQAVIEHAEIGPAIVVGHSYGGARTLRLCVEAPNSVARAVIIDSPIVLEVEDMPQGFLSRGRGSKPFPDYGSALARFRLAPPQSAEPFVLDYVAHHSLRQVEGGWAWKFDLGLERGLPEPNGAELLTRIKTPIDYLHCERSSVISPEYAHRIVQAIGQGRAPVPIPEASHHAMLDQPLVMRATIVSVLLSRDTARQKKYKSAEEDVYDGSRTAGSDR